MRGAYNRPRDDERQGMEIGSGETGKDISAGAGGAKKNAARKKEDRESEGGGSKNGKGKGKGKAKGGSVQAKSRN